MCYVRNRNIELFVDFQNPSQEDGGNYIVRAINEVGDKDCTLALNFGKQDNLERILIKH